MNTQVHCPSSTIPESAEAFAELGFARFTGLISEAERQKVGQIYDELFADPRSQPGFRQLGGVDAGGEQLMPQILGPEKVRPELRGLRAFHALEQLARELLGPEALFVTSHMIMKPAGSPRDTPWHQDQAYHSPACRFRKVNFWIPLDGASIDEGCLWFIPYSHRGSIVPHERLGSGATAIAATDQAYWQANGVPVPLAAGEVSAHHSYCLHYAGPNSGNRPRRAWILVFGTAPKELAKPLHFPWQERSAQVD